MEKVADIVEHRWHDGRRSGFSQKWRGFESPRGSTPLALVLFAKFTQGFSSSYVKRYKKSREEGDRDVVRSICILWKRKNYSILRCLKCQERKREGEREREREREERRSFENPPFLRIYLFKGTRSTSIMRQIHLHQLLRSYRDKCASSADIVERISSFL